MLRCPKQKARYCPRGILNPPGFIYYAQCQDRGSGTVGNGLQLYSVMRSP